MSDINMTATITNGTNQVLQLQNYSGCSQPAVVLQPGDATTVTASSDFQVKGVVTYQLQSGQGQSVSFNFYIPVVGSNSINVQGSPPTYFSGTVSNVSGWSPDIQVVLETVGAVQLAADYSNTYAFVNSMFQPQVRDLSSVWNAVEGGLDVVGFADPTSIQRIVSEWLSLWQGGAPSQPVFASDAAFLQALAQYVQTIGGTNVLWVPQITFAGWSGADNSSPPIYTLTGYTSYPLWENGKWNEDNLTVLLNLLVYGAHCVLIQDPTQPGTVTLPDFYNYLVNTGSVTGLLEQNVWDSHYTDETRNTGMSYPNSITSNATPNPSPLLCALLVGPTVQPTLGQPTYNATSSRDGFFQIEGWPQFGTSTTGRHFADYDSYQACRWNFSTYGACAYSETRGTALFLAPPGWTAVPTEGTFMPPYAGALTPQSWLQTSLIRLSTP